jgi:hypothetical protein
MLGMLGSDHIGERDNAAQLIEQFLRQRGLTWPDLLGRHAAGDDGSGKPGNRPYRAFQQSPPRSAYIRPNRRTNGAQDVAWRWSMLAGLAVVGSISLMSLLQQRAPERGAAVDVAAGGWCQGGVPGGGSPACPPLANAGNGTRSPPTSSSSVSSAAALAAASKQRQPTPFAQGLADHKVAESWRRLAPPGLCLGHFGPDREEFKSACVVADKLLAQFDQRRRTDPEYRRGWNSLTL